ncbi:hypothetical protein CIK05_04540 [Bdellovibrio sp. qaytius]|nr:hypothetical protein CIK05_04540 [Bdellovibrio sp. qaytius]
MVNTITNTLIFIILTLSFGAFAADDTAQSKKQEITEVVEQSKTAPVEIPAKATRVVRRKMPVVIVDETPSSTKIGFSAGLVAWGEQILLQTGDGRSENILIQYTGFSFGLDHTFKGESIGWNNSVKAMFLQGDAQAQGQSISYENKVDAVTPVFVTTGLRFYPHEKVNVTLNVGATYYKLKLQPPTSVVTSYDFKYAEAIQPVAQLQLAWMLSDSFLFQQEIFATRKNDVSAGWNVSLGYVF